MAEPGPQSATKRDLVRTIAARSGLSQAQVLKIVQVTFDSLIDTLASEHRIELRGVGVFEIKRRTGRLGRNPQTGKTVLVKPRWAVTFKPGKSMESRLARIGGSETGPRTTAR